MASLHLTIAVGPDRPTPDRPTRAARPALVSKLANVTWAARSEHAALVTTVVVGYPLCFSSGLVRLVP